jgi:hypothetical protein
MLFQAAIAIERAPSSTSLVTASPFDHLPVEKTNSGDTPLKAPPRCLI